jgi:sugar O-acyltransferase (sialic acid O-acetyltransferase NeuD family)
MRVVVYGSRPDGHANVVLDAFVKGSELTVVGLVDDWSENAARMIGSLKVIGGSADLPALVADGVEGVLLGFGSAAGREGVVRAIEEAGLALPTLVHPSAHVSASARLAEGVQVLPQASIGPGTHVGRGALVNTGAIIEHDNEIGDYSVVDPGAVLTGRVNVGRSVEIGSGAVLIPDVEVGAGATVGAGAVVIGPVAEGETVVGVPARPLSRG